MKDQGLHLINLFWKSMSSTGVTKITPSNSRRASNNKCMSQFSLAALPREHVLGIRSNWAILGGKKLTKICNGKTKNLNKCWNLTVPLSQNSQSYNTNAAAFISLTAGTSSRFEAWLFLRLFSVPVLWLLSHLSCLTALWELGCATRASKPQALDGLFNRGVGQLVLEPCWLLVLEPHQNHAGQQYVSRVTHS